MLKTVIKLFFVGYTPLTTKSHMYLSNILAIQTNNTFFEHWFRDEIKKKKIFIEPTRFKPDITSHITISIPKIFLSTFFRKRMQHILTTICFDTGMLMVINGNIPLMKCSCENAFGCNKCSMCLCKQEFGCDICAISVTVKLR